MSSSAFVQEKELCYHCGEDCQDTSIHLEKKPFCCEGCKMVYQIINQNGLCDYYQLSENPGINQKIRVREGKFGFLDDEEVQKKLIHFTDGQQQHVSFYLPQMHCSSCIWLLEQLAKLNKGIVSAQVNFLKKEVTIIYKSNSISLRKVVELLSSIGYEPHLSLNDVSKKNIKKYDKSRLYKIGIAGFCFGNIMMLSFPEYFSSGEIQEVELKTVFSFLNLALSIPVFFYCASEFFISAYKSLTQKFLNIDAPIALAILITFVRSVYEITSFSGAGYLDSMSGIVFFMLLGRFFQNKTYENISFDRDYTSYFPLGVTVLGNEDEKQIPVSKLKKGDRIKIHSHEIIPADGIIFMGKANIDYSFVSGESVPSEKSIGEIIYAGGKQIGGSIELEVVKEVSQSYLTQLWNNDVFKTKKENNTSSFVHQISKYFTYGLLTIALLTAVYWHFYQAEKMWNAVTSILIVACPCALLLSATFTNGTMLGILRSFNFYIKNAEVLESISNVNTLVFDKTGTISVQEESQVNYIGQSLTSLQEQLIRSLANQSNHPLSQLVSTHLPVQKNLLVKQYVELQGKGSSGRINGHEVKIGSAQFIQATPHLQSHDGSKVYVCIDDEVLGCFVIKTKYRKKMEVVISDLKNTYSLALISGDNNSEEERLRNIFATTTPLLFNQQPQDKLNYIKRLQDQGHKVMMIGDGLNDAGALQQSDVGIAVSDTINNFSPGCDAILQGSSFEKLATIIRFCKKQKQIIYGSFGISLLYNCIGLYYAVQGNLSPVIAAILMPVSTVSIVFFTTGMTRFFARRLKN